MKVLIIEDDINKLEVVISTLSYFPEILITYCDNIYEGKEKLSKNYYDLLVLDMNLPFDRGDEPLDYAGHQLFMELQKVKHLKKPGEIIMLTSYEDLHEKYKADIEKGLFTIIKFDILSNSWCEQIKNRIRYLMSSADDANDTTNAGYDYDFAIISAINVEHTSVLKLLKDIEEHKIKGDNTFYTKGKIEGIEDKKIIVATQHQMGMTAAAVLTTKIIKNFKPKFLIMVGIAAGIKDQGSYGDIITPTEIWDYSSGKVSNSKPKNGYLINQDFNFEPEPKYLAISAKMKEVLNKDYSAILKEINSTWVGVSPSTSVSLIRGPMACGPIVVQNESVIEKLIIPHNRKIKGVDMESYGVLYAVENAYSPRPEVIICKSISDFGDNSKGNEFQEYAAFTSASFLMHLIKNELS